MHDTLGELPVLDDLAFDAPSELFGELNFEDLLEQAATNPADTDVAARLTSQVREVLNNGEVGRAFEMAMVLGATACTHPHLESLANELGEEVLGRMQTPDSHNHGYTETTGRGTSRKEKRRPRTAVSLAELLAKYSWLTRATGQK